jgi:SAM-dependent methyltransferase
MAIEYTELGWREVIVLGTALEEGLLKAVADGPRPADAVAGELSLDVRAVYGVLSAIAELGVLSEGEDGFSLREEHRGPLLDPEHEEYAGQSVMHRLGLIQSWTRLPEVLKSGEPVEDRTSPEFGGLEMFVAAMRRSAAPTAEEVAGMLLTRLPGGARILDVGGGPGTNAEAFARRGARVTVLDLPAVIELTKDRLAQSGIATEAGDMNEYLPEGPFDALYLGHTSHMYGPEENRELFRRMRGSLAPGGLLAIRDYVRGMSEEAALFAVNMLVLTRNGGTYSADEYGGWLADAGFDEVEALPVAGGGSHLILARNPA